MSLISPLIPIILPVIFCAAIGVFWVRFKQPFDHEFVRRIVLWVGAPALIVGTLGQTVISSDLLQHVLLASVCMLAFSALFAAIACLVLRINMRNFVVPLVFGNFGNMGLPLCLFAFGQEGLAIGLGIFLTTTIAHFSFGAAVLSGKAMVKGVLSSPIIYAGIIACLLIFNHWSLPVSIQNTLGLLGGLSIPLMLITLGVSLSSLKLNAAGKSVGLGVLRLFIGLAGGFAAVYVLNLEGLERKVVLLQSAMPAAVFNYLLALQYNREPDVVAGIVVSSTLISFISIPVLLYFLGV
jgi:malate permease and related proteins